MSVEDGQHPTRANPVSGALFDASDADFVANPYPTYDRLRVEDPVHRTQMGLWILTRYDDVALVLRDPRFSRDGFEVAYSAVDSAAAETGRRQPSMLYRDLPDHTRLRAAVSRTFTPRAMDAWRPRIQQLVEELLDRVQGAGAMTSAPTSRRRSPSR
jgi:hypothetical protein